MDLVVLHRDRKYIVEFKIWRSEREYQGGKKQLAAYLHSESASEGYYVVFDHRETPEPAHGDRSSGRCAHSELCDSGSASAAVRSCGRRGSLPSKRTDETSMLT